MIPVIIVDHAKESSKVNWATKLISRDYTVVFYNNQFNYQYYHPQSSQISNYYYPHSNQSLNKIN